MILNNKLLRILQNQSIKTPIRNLYKTFNTLPLPLLHEYRILNFVHTFINNKEKLPVIFESYFVQNKCIPSYDTRKKCDLHLNSIQLTVSKNLLLIRASQSFQIKHLELDLKSIICNQYRPFKLFLL